jgi:hypothetical protein
MEKTIHLKNLSFRQVCVHGRYIPSADSIQMILDDLKDEESNQTFALMHDRTVDLLNREFNWLHFYQYVDFDSTKLQFSPEFEIWKSEWAEDLTVSQAIESQLFPCVDSQSNSISRAFASQLWINSNEPYSLFDKIRQSKCIVKWFQIMLSNRCDFENLQTLNKNFSVFRRVMTGKLSSGRSRKINTELDLNFRNFIIRLENYPEYKKAAKFISEYHLREEALLGEQYLSFLFLSRLEHTSKFAKIVPTSTIKDKPMLCPICKSYSIPIGKVQKHCGSEQCNKSYATIYKKSYRALYIQPKRSIEKSFDGKPKSCIVCSKKLIVNQDGYCNECFK